MDCVIGLLVGFLIGSTFFSESNRDIIDTYTEKPVCITLEVDLNKKMQKCYKLVEVEK